MNATTCWETWHNGTGHHDGIGGFKGAPNSHNHVMLCGGVSAWFWTQLVGLRPTSTAFATISIAPRIDPLLGPASVSANYSSPRGPISIAWRRNTSAMAIELSVDIPLGVSHALVSVPTPFGHGRRYGVRESGINVWDDESERSQRQLLRDESEDALSSEIKWVATEREAVTFRASSGRYRFELFTVKA